MTVNIPNLGPRKIYFRHAPDGTQAFIGLPERGAAPYAFSQTHKHPKDTLVRAVGRRVALARLLDPDLKLTGLNREQRRAVWTEYFRLHRDLRGN